MWVKLWRLLKPFHKTFAWFLGLIVLYEGVQIVESYVISFVIQVFGKEAEFATWALFIIVLFFCDEFFMRLDNALDWHIISCHLYPIHKFLKMKAISKFMNLDIDWHEDHNSGALVGKVNNGTDRISEIVEGLSWEFVPTFIQALLSLIPLLIISPLAVAISIPALGLFMWLSVESNQERQPLREERHDLYEQDWHRSIQFVQAVETVIMFGQRKRVVGEHEALHNRIISLGLQEARIGVYEYGRWRIRILSWARRLILIIWIWQLYQGSLSIAGLVYADVLAGKLFNSVWRFARIHDRITEASEGAERLINLLEQESAISDNGKVKQIPGPIGIQLINVDFTYEQGGGGGIHNLDLEIEPGQTVALVGVSGAGKTTFRKLITRLRDIDSGTILVGGVDIRDWSHSALLSRFSFVPQGDDVYIFSDTIARNISFGEPAASLEQIMQAAKLAGIHDFIETLPKGYNTFVGERGKRLSAGQKQRVALARAFLDPEVCIIVLDEPTSSVDVYTEQVIQAQMEKALKGKTVIIIAHRLSTIRNADKIVVLHEGEKVEEGTHKKLMALGGLYAKMVQLQAL